MLAMTTRHQIQYLDDIASGRAAPAGLTSVKLETCIETFNDTKSDRRTITNDYPGADAAQNQAIIDRITLALAKKSGGVLGLIGKVENDGAITAFLKQLKTREQHFATIAGAIDRLSNKDHADLTALATLGVGAGGATAQQIRQHLNNKTSLGGVNFTDSAGINHDSDQVLLTDAQATELQQIAIRKINELKIIHAIEQTQHTDIVRLAPIKDAAGANDQTKAQRIRAELHNQAHLGNVDFQHGADHTDDEAVLTQVQALKIQQVAQRKHNQLTIVVAIAGKIVVDAVLTAIANARDHETLKDVLSRNRRALGDIDPNTLTPEQLNNLHTFAVQKRNELLVKTAIADMATGTIDEPRMRALEALKAAGDQNAVRQVLQTHSTLFGNINLSGHVHDQQRLTNNQADQLKTLATQQYNFLKVKAAIAKKTNPGDAGLAALVNIGVVTADDIRGAINGVRPDFDNVDNLPDANALSDQQALELKTLAVQKQNELVLRAAIDGKTVRDIAHLVALKNAANPAAIRAELHNKGTLGNIAVDQPALLSDDQVRSLHQFAICKHNQLSIMHAIGLNLANPDVLIRTGTQDAIKALANTSDNATTIRDALHDLRFHLGGISFGSSIANQSVLTDEQAKALRLYAQQLHREYTIGNKLAAITSQPNAVLDAIIGAGANATAIRTAIQGQVAQLGISGPELGLLAASLANNDFINNDQAVALGTFALRKRNELKVKHAIENLADMAVLAAIADAGAGGADANLISNAIRQAIANNHAVLGGDIGLAAHADDETLLANHQALLLKQVATVRRNELRVSAVIAGKNDPADVLLLALNTVGNTPTEIRRVLQNYQAQFGGVDFARATDNETVLTDEQARTLRQAAVDKLAALKLIQTTAFNQLKAALEAKAVHDDPALVAIATANLANPDGIRQRLYDNRAALANVPNLNAHINDQIILTDAQAQDLVKIAKRKQNELVLKGAIAGATQAQLALITGAVGHAAIRSALHQLGPVVFGTNYANETVLTNVQAEQLKQIAQRQLNLVKISAALNGPVPTLAQLNGIADAPDETSIRQQLDSKAHFNNVALGPNFAVPDHLTDDQVRTIKTLATQKRNERKITIAIGGVAHANLAVLDAIGAAGANADDIRDALQVNRLNLGDVDLGGDAHNENRLSDAQALEIRRLAICRHNFLVISHAINQLEDPDNVHLTAVGAVPDGADLHQRIRTALNGTIGAVNLGAGLGDETLLTNEQAERLRTEAQQKKQALVTARDANFAAIKTAISAIAAANDAHLTALADVAGAEDAAGAQAIRRILNDAAHRPHLGRVNLDHHEADAFKLTQDKALELRQFARRKRNELTILGAIEGIALADIARLEPLITGNPAGIRQALEAGHANFIVRFPNVNALDVLDDDQTAIIQRAAQHRKIELLVKQAIDTISIADRAQLQPVIVAANPAAIKAALHNQAHFGAQPANILSNAKATELQQYAIRKHNELTIKDAIDRIADPAHLAALLAAGDENAIRDALTAGRAQLGGIDFAAAGHNHDEVLLTDAQATLLKEYAQRKDNELAVRAAIVAVEDPDLAELTAVADAAPAAAPGVPPAPVPPAALAQAIRTALHNTLGGRGIPNPANQDVLTDDQAIQLQREALDQRTHLRAARDANLANIRGAIDALAAAGNIPAALLLAADADAIRTELNRAPPALDNGRLAGHLNDEFKLTDAQAQILKQFAIQKHNQLTIQAAIDGVLDANIADLDPVIAAGDPEAIRRALHNRFGIDLNPAGVAFADETLLTNVQALELKRTAIRKRDTLVAARNPNVGLIITAINGKTDVTDAGLAGLALPAGRPAAEIKLAIVTHKALLGVGAIPDADLNNITDAQAEIIRQHAFNKHNALRLVAAIDAINALPDPVLAALVAPAANNASAIRQILVAPPPLGGVVFDAASAANESVITDVQARELKASAIRKNNELQIKAAIAGIATDNDAHLIALVNAGNNPQAIRQALNAPPALGGVNFAGHENDDVVLTGPKATQIQQIAAQKLHANVLAAADRAIQALADQAQLQAIVTAATTHAADIAQFRAAFAGVYRDQHNQLIQADIATISAAASSRLAALAAPAAAGAAGTMAAAAANPPAGGFQGQPVQINLIANRGIIDRVYPQGPGPGAGYTVAAQPPAPTPPTQYVVTHPGAAAGQPPTTTTIYQTGLRIAPPNAAPNAYDKAIELLIASARAQLGNPALPLININFTINPNSVASGQAMLAAYQRANVPIANVVIQGPHHAALQAEVARIQAAQPAAAPAAPAAPVHPPGVAGPPAPVGPHAAPGAPPPAAGGHPPVVVPPGGRGPGPGGVIT